MENTTGKKQKMVGNLTNKSFKGKIVSTYKTDLHDKVLLLILSKVSPHWIGQSYLSLGVCVVCLLLLHAGVMPVTVV